MPLGQCLRLISPNSGRKLFNFVDAGTDRCARAHLPGLKIARRVIVAQRQRSRQHARGHLRPLGSRGIAPVGIATQLHILDFADEGGRCPNSLAIVEQRHREMIDERLQRRSLARTISGITVHRVRSLAGNDSSAGIIDDRSNACAAFIPQNLEG
jgi:hypothetical protein